jgi:hypothetical protein
MKSRESAGQSPVEVAASALETAALTLRACSGTIKALDADIARLEADIAALRAERCAVLPLQPVSAARAAVDLETRSHVNTATAARWLNRNPQTLRKWACVEDGPLRPRRVGGRLAWAVADIRAILAASPA